MAKRAKNGYWLFKQEPASYSFTDLERDGRTTWDGVANPLAQQHLRQVQPGDLVFFYHTGKDRAVVGTMTVVAAPAPAAEGGKAVVVEVEPLRRLTHPVSLTRIKEDDLLHEWDLVRLPRLSVLPVTPEHWNRVLELSEESE